MIIINPLECFFGIEGLVALDRNPVPWYDNLLLQLIPGELWSACPHRQFHTLPTLLHSQAALSNSYPNTCVPSREAVCSIFMTVFCVNRPGHEPLTYCMGGGHAYHLDILTWRQIGVKYQHTPNIKRQTSIKYWFGSNVMQQFSQEIIIVYLAWVENKYKMQNMIYKVTDNPIKKMDIPGLFQFYGWKRVALIQALTLAQFLLKNDYGWIVQYHIICAYQVSSNSSWHHQVPSTLHHRIRLQHLNKMMRHFSQMFNVNSYNLTVSMVTFCYTGCHGNLPSYRLPSLCCTCSRRWMYSSAESSPVTEVGVSARPDDTDAVGDGDGIASSEPRIFLQTKWKGCTIGSFGALGYRPLLIFLYGAI